MATRSSIAQRNKDGTIQAVYCHWDGYIENNGRILFDHYQDPAKIELLLAPGDISSLGYEVGDKHPFDNPHLYGSEARAEHERLYGAWTTYFGRDRGETGCEPRLYADVEAWLASEAQEFHYLWTGEEWLVNEYCERDGYEGYLLFDRVSDRLQTQAA